MPDARPDPDALLRLQRGQERGRLKVFLGAAPGVGKTWEMLTAGHARKREGRDVVIALVETHGRAETEALVEGLERLPTRTIEYKGRALQEMDLDALLARRPSLALIDELAHSNVEGSRHPKRWMDVEDVLAAGIDVYTTVNIQHLESLNDVVAAITRIRVRETVPDQVIERADEIELVDLTPQDLIQRVRDGKVYAARTASRALAHYFSPGNLTALRELALRRTAQRVDAQLLDHMRAGGIPGPWAAGERVLVALDPRAGGADLLRYARRLAERLRAPWTVLHVEPPEELSEPDRARLADQLRLAETLGAETVTLPGRDPAAEILAYARARNFTAIVAARRAAPRRRFGRPGPIARLIEQAGDIPVHVVGGERHPPDPPAPPRPLALRPFLGSALLVSLAAGVGEILTRFVAPQTIALAFLTAVIASAAAFGLPAALAASALSVLAYNFLFLPPLYTFTIADPENVVSLFFFLVTALIAGNLSARVRAQALAARTRADITEALYRFSRTLAGITEMDDLLWATVSQIAALLKRHVVLLLPEGERLTVRAGFPPEDRLDPADLAAAHWAWQHDKAAGRGADTLPGARRLFLPLRAGNQPVAVLGLDGPGTGPLLDPPQRRLLDALADQAALAIGRVQLTRDLADTRLQAETERLRAALLTSLSHDLRTPLAAILGAATGLASLGAQLDEAARADLLATIRDEAERMNRFVGNLLDMTRLEAGAVVPRTEPTDAAEVAASALRRAAQVLGAHETTLAVAPGLPAARADPVLLEQVLFNLLDNAAKYAPAGTAIEVALAAPPHAVEIAVADHGPGIPEDALPHIFDKFARVHRADRQRPGTGLGLAICRGFVEAMGGTIEAGNRAPHGAVFRVRLPAATEGPE